MRTTYRTTYGPPEILKVVETEIPTPGDKELLIRVHAATVNRTDCGVLTGMPYIFRLFTGLPRPRYKATGTDFAGVIAGMGSKVTGYSIGESVWGFHDEGIGSHAEYFTISTKHAIARIPEKISFAQAAASAEGAHYAINFIRKVKLRAGQQVLVNGASGGIGSAAVQLLRERGVRVTAVCDTRSLDTVRSLGAERVIDYTQEDFTTLPGKYPFIFDAVGKSTFGKCKPLLEERGVYISSELGPGWENLYLALFTPLTGGHRVVFPLPVKIHESVAHINQLLAEGKFMPVIDRAYPLEQIADAFTYVASGRKMGNVIVLCQSKDLC